MTPNAEFLKAITEEAQKTSLDRSTRVGCVILRKGAPAEEGIFAANSFPEGVHVEVEARHERPAKYKWTEHAERNAIYVAARHGLATEGATMYLPWYPCADCARAIIQCGIAELVCYEPNWNDKTWGEDFKIAAQMLSEAGVKQTFEEKLP